MSRTTIAAAGLLLAAAVLVAGASPSLAGKGGGKPGGGGGTEPKPAIAYFEGSDLYVMDADGSNPTLLVASTKTTGASCCWSPDGTVIYFDGAINGQGIYACDVATKVVTRVHSGSASRLACSPALDDLGHYRVSFNEVPAGSTTGNDIWLLDPVTQNVQNLTASLLLLGPEYGRTESYATWSPDGDRIAWRFNTFNRDGGGSLYNTSAGLEVYTFTFVGSKVVLGNGTQYGVDSADPDAVGFTWLDWSRTALSDVLAFVDYDETNLQYDLSTIDLSSNTVTLLTSTGSIDERSPSWAPNDDTLVFWRSGTAKESGLYTISSGGGSPTFLGARQGRGPAWKR